MNLILFDDPVVRTRLLPLTYTRPVSEMRVGVLKIREKWEKLTSLSSSILTEPYLAKKFPLVREENNHLVNGAICPDDQLWESIKGLDHGEGLFWYDKLVAANIGEADFSYPFSYDGLVKKEYKGQVTYIDRTWHIFLENGDEIRKDYNLITSGRDSQAIKDPHSIVYKPEDIFLEEGVKIRAAILNAENGPIYIGKNVEIQEGAIIQGPAAFAENSGVTMGAKIRDNTTVGPYAKVGGEVKNSVIFGYSNKQHEGFLGNSVIGEWCNIGADANISNLKNNYASVRVWDYETEKFIDSGLQFNGTIMGDHSKLGINTMMNTGTIVGVGSNIYGSGFPRNFIPSFSWGGAHGFTEFRLNKFYEIAEKVMSRRDLEFSEIEKGIIDHVSKISAKFRKFS